jgi:hypothetical protein
MPATNVDPNTVQPMSNIKLIAASVISITSVILVTLHIIAPTVVTLDQATLILLALGALPWLTLFFKTLEIPGFAKVEAQERTQGFTANPLPPARALRVVPEGLLSDSAKKVLATLWRYQRQLFGTDMTKRWTFEVSPFAPDYREYLSGLSELVNRGLASVSPETHQAMLTNEGITYARGNEEIQTHTDVFLF